MTGKRDVALRLWLFVFACSFYCLVCSGHYGGDALNNYLTTESIVLRHELAIEPASFPVKEIKIDNDMGAEGKDGRRYSQFGIGMPLLQVPLFLLGLFASKIIASAPQAYLTFFSVSFTNAVISALNTVLIFMVMSALRFDRARAVALSVVYSFATMAAVYSKTGFSEPAVIMFLLLSLYSLFSRRDNADRNNIRFIIFSGASLGLAGLVRDHTIIILPAFALYLLFEKNGLKAAAIFVISYMAVFSLELAVNILRFGGPFQTGYGNAVKIASTSGNKFFSGIYYYWLSSGKGFFLYNIPLIAGLFAWRSLREKRPGEFRLLVSIIAVYAVYFAFFFKRGSIFCWGPRYLLPIVPVFILLMEGMFKKRALVIVLAALAVTGALVQLPAILVNYSKYIFFVKEALHLEEYLINYVPGLSPVYGCWHLLLGCLQKSVSGAAHIFSYLPDPVFIKAVAADMSGYAIADIWYLNLPAFSKGLQLIAAAVAGMLLFVFMASGYILYVLTKEKIRGR
jgi:hypothetical protein